MISNRLEQLKKLEELIRHDPAILTGIFERREETLAGLDFLDASIKASLSKVSLFEVLTGLSGILGEMIYACGDASCGKSATCGDAATCSDTCAGATCGPSTCSDTCSIIKSCSDTCIGESCAGGCTMSDPSTLNDPPVGVVGQRELEILVGLSDRVRGIDPKELQFRPFFR